MRLKKGQTYSRKQLCEILGVKYNTGSDNIFLLDYLKDIIDIVKEP